MRLSPDFMTSVPQLLPKFVCTQDLDGTYYVERLYRGEYIQTNMRFTVKEECDSMVERLNEEESEQSNQ